MNAQIKKRRRIVRPASPDAVYPTITEGMTALKGYLTSRQPQTCNQIRKALGVSLQQKFAQNTVLSHFLTLAVRQGEIHAVVRPDAKRRKLYSLTAPDGQQYLPFVQDDQPEKRPRLQVVPQPSPPESPPPPAAPAPVVAAPAPAPVGRAEVPEDELMQRVGRIKELSAELEHAQGVRHDAAKNREKAEEAARCAASIEHQADQEVARIQAELRKLVGGC